MILPPLSAEHAVTHAVEKLLDALDLLGAAGEIDSVELAIMAGDGRLRLRFEDAAGIPQELMLPSTPDIREIVMREKEKAEQVANQVAAPVSATLV
jgi:hypothetical protein